MGQSYQNSEYVNIARMALSTTQWPESIPGITTETTMEKLARLKPVLGGVFTAGNSSSENDGAAAVVLMSAEKADSLGLSPIARIVSCAVAGDDPRKAYATVPS